MMLPVRVSTLASTLYRGLRIGAVGMAQLRRACSTERGLVPRRAMLYVPGNDERKVLKVRTLDVDCAVLDCEDGVALNKKDDARHNITKMLLEVDFGRTESAVRINSVTSGLAEEDLRVVMGATKLPPTLMIPKVDEPHHMEWFAETLNKCLGSRTLDARLKVVIFVESAIGLLNFRDTCQRAIELEQTAPFQLDGVVFGSDDFVADIGATRTEDAKELLFARQNVVVVAKAFRIQAIDLVHINYKDLDGLRVQSEEGARMGFTGKQVIHPTQVKVVQEAFSPTAERIAWASQLIEAFNTHQDSGKGAFTFRGQMIDMPLLLQAKNIVQLADVITASKS